MSWGAGGGGRSVLLGLLMWASPTRVRSAPCPSSTVWMSPDSTSHDCLFHICAVPSCVWGVGDWGVQQGPLGDFCPGGVVPEGPGGLWAEPGLVEGLSLLSWAGAHLSWGGDAFSLPLVVAVLLLTAWAVAGVERVSSVEPGGKRRNSGNTRSSFLSSPRWSSALLL